MEPRWKPSPALRATFALHAMAGAVAVAQPGAWPWAFGALAANHVLIVAAGLWPRSTLLGPNLLRLPDQAARRSEVALTLDDGPDAKVTPAVLDLLDEHDAKASFFCVGERARKHPALVREIARRGHSVENHSARHSHWFSLYGLRKLRHEIEQAQDTLGRLTGRLPEFFRAPAGLRNPFLDPVLTSLRLAQVSWTRRGFDTVTHNPATVLRRLTAGLAPGDILLLHDGHSAVMPDGRPVALAVLPKLLDVLAQRGLKSTSLPTAVT
jgi:peptidoglycan/xylan/chitin deacetylase (PgdA/CDA1 family)